MKSLIGNEAVIEELISDLNELGYRIKRIDMLITQIDNSETKKAYTKDLIDIIQYYKQISGILRMELLKYIAIETEKKAPVNLKYRKILKNLDS